MAIYYGYDHDHDCDDCSYDDSENDFDSDEYDEECCGSCDNYGEFDSKS